MLVIIIKNQCQGCREIHFDTFDTDTFDTIDTSPRPYNAAKRLFHCSFPPKKRRMNGVIAAS